MTYFLKSNTEVEIPCFTFYVINHSCMWLATPISERKQEQVFGNILGKMFFK